MNERITISTLKYLTLVADALKYRALMEHDIPVTEWAFYYDALDEFATEHGVEGYEAFDELVTRLAE